MILPLLSMVLLSGLAVLQPEPTPLGMHLGTVPIAMVSPRQVSDPRTIREQWVKAYNAQDGEAVARCYAVDATYIGTGGDVTKGRSKIAIGVSEEVKQMTGMTVTPSELNSTDMNSILPANIEHGMQLAIVHYRS